ncbi:MAG: polymerase primary sigma factor [Frankiales bacterium]|nr:polymerase primary sigma factor [Frankiales bacterium]
MPTAARPADKDVVVEALVQRAASEGQMSLAQLRTTFEQAGIGPDQARAVLRRLTEGGMVIGSEGGADEPRKSRRAAVTRPAPARMAGSTRPAGRTTPATASETHTEETETTVSDTEVSTVSTPTRTRKTTAKATAEATVKATVKATVRKAADKPAAGVETAPAPEVVEEAAEATAEAAEADEPEDAPLALDEAPPGIDLVKAYLREIGRVALLTAVEEVDLAKRIEAGLFAAEKLRQSAEAGIKLTPTMKRDFTWIIRDGDKAKRHLLEANLRLVVSLAKRYQGRGLDLLDLVQEGNLGLVRAVEKFDYAKGYKFSTYATWWIRQALQRALADQGRTIRVPVHMAELITKVTRVRRELTQSLGRDPSPEEIGQPLEMTAAKVEEIIAFGRDTLSLQSPVGDDEATLGDFITDTEAVDPVASIETQMLQTQLSQVLDSLPERSAIVVRMRFGLDDGRPRTLDEVGRHLGLTRERIRQIERDTLAELRMEGRADGLKEYVA